MKLLLYSEFFYPVPGGTQSFVRQLARGISQPHAGPTSAGAWEVTLVTQTAGDRSLDTAEPFRIVRRPGKRALFRLMRDADVIHIAGPALLPLALAFLLNKPFFVEHHGCQVACPNGLLFYEPTQSPCPGHFMARRYQKCAACNRETAGARRSLLLLLSTPLRRWLCNRAQGNIMPTDWLRSTLQLKNAPVIHHGLPSGTPLTTAAGSSRWFAFQGRLVTTKGVRTLLEAAGVLSAEGRSFGLKIIGDGPEMAALRTAAAPLGNRVEFFGHVDDTRLEQLLSDVLAVVMPSLGGEVFGLVAAENMLRGKLAIVSDLGALREVVGETGLVFPAGDPSALADRMRQVLDHPEIAASLGSAARERAMQLFCLRDMIEAHVSLYRNSGSR